MSRIVIVTEAHPPQVNGVVMRYEKVSESLRSLGHEVFFVTPQDFPNIPYPFYKGIYLGAYTPGMLGKKILSYNPTHIHLVTEWIGGWALKFLKREGIPFTSSFHTRFVDYSKIQLNPPQFVLDFVHKHSVLLRSEATHYLVSSEGLAEDLMLEGYSSNYKVSPPGINKDVFNPEGRILDFGALPRPYHLYVGRISEEKNLTAFLDLDLPGSKILVGPGPRLGDYQGKYGNHRTLFLGPKFGEELASIYRASDVFVFPSRTDTYGLVVQEAISCGLPVAAFNVMGPKYVVENGITGVLENDDLKGAIDRALTLNRDKVIEGSNKFLTWGESSQVFYDSLVAI